jgi:hypothetical protein
MSLGWDITHSEPRRGSLVIYVSAPGVNPKAVHSTMDRLTNTYYILSSSGLSDRGNGVFIYTAYVIASRPPAIDDNAAWQYLLSAVRAASLAPPPSPSNPGAPPSPYPSGAPTSCPQGQKRIEIFGAPTCVPNSYPDNLGTWILGGAAIVAILLLKR